MLLALIVGSLGLWVLVWLGLTAYDVAHPGYPLDQYPRFVEEHRHFILVVPVPLVVWGVFLLKRPGPTVDQVVLYMALVSLAYGTAFIACTIGALMPWATIVTR